MTYANIHSRCKTYSFKYSQSYHKVSRNIPLCSKFVYAIRYINDIVITDTNNKTKKAIKLISDGNITITNAFLINF